MELDEEIERVKNLPLSVFEDALKDLDKNGMFPNPEDAIVSRGIHIAKTARVDIPSGSIVGEVRGWDRDAETVILRISVPADWITEIDP